MKDNTYTFTIYTENSIGLLNRISGIFLRRHVNIESLTATKSEIENISQITIVTHTTEKWVKHIVKKIEQQVEVIKAHYHLNNEIIYLENSLFKMPTKTLLDDSKKVQKIIKKHNVTIVSVYKDFYVISKSGSRKSIDKLYKALKPYGILQFVCSGRIAVSKDEMDMSSVLHQLKKD